MNIPKDLNHSTLIISLTISLFWVGGCGEENPLEPSGRPSIIPLAKGASWEYNYNYYHQGYGGYYTHKGKYFVSVQDQYDYPDSIIYVVNTAKLPDNENEDSTITAEWRILYKSDTLWTKRNQADWKYMMPARAPEAEEFDIDIGLFVPLVGGGEYFYYFGVCKGKSDGDSIRIFYAPLNSAVINKSGISDINLFWHAVSTIHPEYVNFDMSLEKYTPGTS